MVLIQKAISDLHGLLASGTLKKAKRKPRQQTEYNKFIKETMAEVKREWLVTNPEATEKPKSKDLIEECVKRWYILHPDRKVARDATLAKKMSP